MCTWNSSLLGHHSEQLSWHFGQPGTLAADPSATIARSASQNSAVNAGTGDTAPTTGATSILWSVGHTVVHSWSSSSSISVTAHGHRAGISGGHFGLSLKNRHFGHAPGKLVFCQKTVFSGFSRKTQFFTKNCVFEYPKCPPLTARAGPKCRMTDHVPTTVSTA